MERLSGFTFVHNGVEGGYPFVEAIRAVQPYVDEMVVADMQSTDETRKVLEQLDVKILDGLWTPGTAGECLRNAHALHTKCTYDWIWHFEADEVFSYRLVEKMFHGIRNGIWRDGISVRRIQIEQNFQRVRWYPVEVHRFFKKGDVTKDGHTTSRNNAQYYSKWARGNLMAFGIGDGLLWDVTNCLRDDWVQRVRNQAELRDGVLNYGAVGLHSADGFNQVTDVEKFLSSKLWTAKYSPFDLPESLKKLVGVTSYREHLQCLKLI